MIRLGGLSCDDAHRLRANDRGDGLRRDVRPNENGPFRHASDPSLRFHDAHEQPPPVDWRGRPGSGARKHSDEAYDFNNLQIEV